MLCHANKTSVPVVGISLLRGSLRCPATPPLGTSAKHRFETISSYIPFLSFSFSLNTVSSHIPFTFPIVILFFLCVLFSGGVFFHARRYFDLGENIVSGQLYIDHFIMYS